MSPKTLPGAGAPIARDNPMVAVWQTTPPDTDELLRRIAALGQRITAYVEFMGQAHNLNGASTESKDKALAAFYEKLLSVERQLARIHDNFRLE
jgi:hypothetical protein